MGRLQPITTEETKNQSSVVDFLWIIVLELIHDIWTDIISQYWITAQRLSVGLGGAGSVTHITPCSSYEPRRDAQHGYFWREEWTNNKREVKEERESIYKERIKTGSFSLVRGVVTVCIWLTNGVRFVTRDTWQHVGVISDMLTTGLTFPLISRSY